MLDRLFKLLMPWRRPPPAAQVADIFRVRYDRFKTLLHANSELSRTIGDIEEKNLGNQLFGMTYVRAQTERSLFYTRQMIDCLNDISSRRYPQLYPALDAIEARLRAQIGEKNKTSPVGWTVPFENINRTLVDQVGTKSANLGEVKNRGQLPIPGGFAITVQACIHFMQANGLPDFIREKMEQDLHAPEDINQASIEIHERITASPVPAELEKSILEAYDALVAEVRRVNPEYDGRISVRSSAVGEDSDLSHAGQYLTVLNVSRDQILDAWVRVIASLFSPWAITYRVNKGFHDDDLNMGVACLQMLEPVTSGVAFSRHPFNALEDVAVLNAVWGLGPYAVDGTVTPDLYTVSRDEHQSRITRRISVKDVKLVGSPEGGLVEVEVPAEQQDAPCLADDQIRALARFAANLENLYSSPQDIEWAIDATGHIFILQSRPLQLSFNSGRAAGAEESSPSPYPVLVEGGATAHPGVGCGPIHLVQTDEDLASFPEGAVLLSRHPSPRYVLAMKRAQAILTDTGSPLGHMASLCREYRIPTLLDTRVATTQLTNGQLVTVDSEAGRVYEGRVEELLQRKRAETTYMQGTPEAKALARVYDDIVPLHLTNPRHANFTPSNCKSLHDIMRFVHESSYAAMFQISDLLSASDGATVKLVAPIPLDLYIIDLGGGLAPEAVGKRSVLVTSLASVPFKALLEGMLHPDLKYHHPRPIELRGLMSVMSEQMLTPPGAGGERFGDKSYAIISDRYLHFSSRIGYHYSILDAWVDTQNRKNHITFSFQGGAADPIRRGRRAKAVSLVLKNHGFTVDQKADRVDARMKRAEQGVMLEKLAMLGRLLQFTRQLDMLMHSEQSVQHISQAFMDGRYQLQ